jgi:pimeloyl-ACP methyl ester carboxylesterase
MRYYAQCLRELLDSLGLNSVFLLGHSMGGVIAQEFYRMFPTYVRALILADTRSGPSKDGLKERLTAIRTMTPAQIAEARAPKLLSPNAPADIGEEAISIMSEIRAAGYEFAALALAESDTSDVLRQLNVPTLLIWGADDGITPVWTELPAGVRSEIVLDAGHLCYLEQPDRFNQIVRQFCTSVGAAEGDRTY